MRVVLDTMVFLRALMNRRGRWGYLFFDLRGRYTLLLSPDIVAEIIEVLTRSKLAHKLPQRSNLRWDELLDIMSDAEVVEPALTVDICRDPKDNKFFECAVEGRADYIVSEDRDVLDVGSFEGVTVVSAAAFVRLLEETG